MTFSHRTLSNPLRKGPIPIKSFGLLASPTGFEPVVTAVKAVWLNRNSNKLLGRGRAG